MSCSIGTMARVNLSVCCCIPCIVPILAPPHQLYLFLQACTLGCTHSVVHSIAQALQG